jgi:glucose-6-phosphate dehydrogenase assembly protein OpcA
MVTLQHEVDISKIERDLVELLRQPENLSTNGQPGMRTAVLTLVTVASDAGTQDRIVATLAALFDHHPSRTLLIRTSPDAPRDLDAWVNVSCKALGTSGLKACVDQIVIESNPAALRRVPNVVLPLLLAELPVVLWWPGEPPLREPLLFDLLEPATRFVVDTLGFVHVERTLINLNNLRQRPTVRVDLGDLNWDRLLAWRELVAQFWDVPAWRAQLRSVDRVELDLGKPAGGRSNRAQGLLLVGWLASRLGWKPRGMERRNDGYRMVARRSRRDLEIIVRILPGQPSGVRALRLGVGAKKVVYAVRAEGSDGAVMTIGPEDGEPTYQRIARLETLDEPQLLAQELDTTTVDRVYEESLGAAAAFLTTS